jgi:SAM-dependent methyltransferase
MARIAREPLCVASRQLELRMISRSARTAYYALLAIPMRVSGSLYRHFRAPRTGVLKVQLGPGRQNYLEGWTNVDANLFTARCDVWADLRNPLPFRDDTVDAFYSYHVIEHLPEALLPFHFAEMLRCLKPGGVIRVGGPHADNAMRKFVEGDHEWFSSDFPDRRSSLGGRLSNFLLCGGEHLGLLTSSFLQEIADQTGFVSFRVCSPVAETSYPEIFDEVVLGKEYEGTPEAPHTIMIEAVKPESSDTPQAARPEAVGASH